MAEIPEHEDTLDVEVLETNEEEEPYGREFWQRLNAQVEAQGGLPRRRPGEHSWMGIDHELAKEMAEKLDPNHPNFNQNLWYLARDLEEFQDQIDEEEDSRPDPIDLTLTTEGKWSVPTGTSIMMRETDHVSALREALQQ